MNHNDIIRMAEKAELIRSHHNFILALEKFSELIVYDFLSELTNDDSLGEARIATIKRLAEKWEVSR